MSSGSWRVAQAGLGTSGLHRCGPTRTCQGSGTCKARATVGDHVKQGVWQEAGSSETLQHEVPLPLGQLAAVRVDEQWQVCKAGWRPAQGLVQEQVLGSGHQPLRAPQHVAHAHVVVVHHAGQVVGGEAVALQDDRVPLHAGHLVPSPAVHQVLEGRRLLVQAKADGRLGVAGQLLGHLLLAQVPASIVIAVGKQRTDEPYCVCDKCTALSKRNNLLASHKYTVYDVNARLQ